MKILEYAVIGLALIGFAIGSLIAFALFILESLDE